MLIPLLIAYLIAAPYVLLDQGDCARSASLAAQYPLSALVDLTPQYASKEDLIAHYKKTFEEKIRRADEEFQTDSPIPKAAWEEIRQTRLNHLRKQRAANKSNYKSYRNSAEYKALDRRATQLIEQTLTACGVDIQEVVIAQNTATAIAEVHEDSTLVFNPRYFKALSDDHIRAIIAHEAQHIIFEDTALAITTIKIIDGQTLLNLGTDEQRANAPTKFDRFYNTLSKIQEARADTFAALQSLQHALDFREWLILEHHGDVDVDHPTMTQRLELNAAIITQLAAIPDECKKLSRKKLRAKLAILRWLGPHKQLKHVIIRDFYSGDASTCQSLATCLGILCAPYLSSQLRTHRAPSPPPQPLRMPLAENNRPAIPAQ